VNSATPAGIVMLPSMTFVNPAGLTVESAKAVVAGSVFNKYTRKLPVVAALCATGTLAAGGIGTFHLHPTDVTAPANPAAVISDASIKYLVLTNLREPWGALPFPDVELFPGITVTIPAGVQVGDGAGVGVGLTPGVGVGDGVGVGTGPTFTVALKALRP
jgi:hypothetical protein